MASVPQVPSGLAALQAQSETASLSSIGISVLSDFVPQKNWAAVQDSVYVVLGHGPYQRRVLLCGIASVVVLLLHYVSFRLVGRPADHWCKPPDHFSQLSAEAWRNLSIPVEPDGSFSHCTMYDPALPEGEHGNRTVVPCRKWYYDIASTDDSIVSRYDLVCERRNLYNMSLFLTTAGTGCLAPVLVFAADRVGRRPMTIASTMGLLFAAVGNCFAETYEIFIASRTVILATANATYLLTFVLLFEVTGHSRRWLFTLFQTAVGATIVSPSVYAISLLEPGWVLAHALLLVPTMALALCSFLLEESPVWLLARCDLRRAEASVLAACKANGVDLQKAKATFRIIMCQLQKMEVTQKRPLARGAPVICVWAVKIHRFAASAFLSRFTLNALYFGLVATERPKGMYMQIADVMLLTSLYAAICWSMNKYGLRDTLLALLSAVYACLVIELVLAVFAIEQASSFVHVAMVPIVTGSMTTVLCYTGEIFPTESRSVGVSVSLVFGSAGSLAGIFLMLAGPHGNLAHNAFSAAMVFLCIVAIQWLPKVLIENPEEERPAGVLNEAEKEAPPASSSLPDEAMKLKKSSKQRSPRKPALASSPSKQ
ncbi:hypothetical protein V5799_033119 [Amblyomma americanum]|uniref:Uncharacterized protein n=1 Tax=Amblyomma americanum TaxID=6943 RepID=A0AAQ4DP81_AMBAM